MDISSVDRGNFEKVLFNNFIDLNQLIFSKVEKHFESQCDKSKLEKIRSDFQEFCEKFSNLCNKHKGRMTVNILLDDLPQNSWALFYRSLMNGKFLTHVTTGEEAITAEDLEELVQEINSFSSGTTIN